MNRIFHARIAWYHYFLLVVLTVNLGMALWCKYALPALLLVILLIVVIEQIIHTLYTFTADGLLIIERGRFVRKKVIPLAEVTAVRRLHSMRIGRLAVSEYLLIEYGQGKCASVTPLKEKEADFVKWIEKHR